MTFWDDFTDLSVTSLQLVRYVGHVPNVLCGRPCIYLHIPTSHFSIFDILDYVYAHYSSFLNQELSPDI